MMGRRSLSGIALSLAVVTVPSLTAQPCQPSLLSAARYDQEAYNFLPGAGRTELVGDVDGRLGPDVVLASSLSGSLGVQVFLNAGAGVLQRRWVFGDPSRVGGAALGDVDCDGDIDLIIVRLDGLPPLFFLNDGRGGFAQETPGSRIRDALFAKSVVAADLDGDGWTDIFVGMTDPHPSRVYLNDRAGSFLDATATHLTTPVFGCVHHVVSADLDRDGDTDLVLAMGGNCGPQQDNLVLVNDGRGHLAVTPLVGLRGWTAVVAVGDLDGDALPDLFFGNLSGPSELWINRGSGTFSDASARVPGGTTTTLSATIVDLDRDGLNDIVAGVQYAGIGGFGFDTYRNLGQASFVVDRGLIHQAGSPLPNFVQAADMDRDGDDDLVVAGPIPFPSRVGLRVLIHTHRHVLPTAPPALGTPWQIDLHAQPGQLVFPALAAVPADLDLGTLGILGLAPASLVMLPFVDMRATCTQSVSIPIPNNSWLRNRPVYCQAYVLDPQNPIDSHLTNWTVDSIR